jgi:hypothetical protein
VQDNWTASAATNPHEQGRKANEKREAPKSLRDSQGTAPSKRDSSDNRRASTSLSKPA